MEEEIKKLKKENLKIKEFLLINVLGIYNSKDVEKDFNEYLKNNKEYINKNKVEL